MRRYSGLAARTPRSVYRALPILLVSRDRNDSLHGVRGSIARPWALVMFVYPTLGREAIRSWGTFAKGKN